MELNETLTLQELCKLLGVTRQSVYRWLQTGKAPKHERKGDRVLFDRQDAMRMKNERKRTTRS